MSKKMFDRLKVEMWIGATANREGDGGWAVHLHSCILGRHFTKTKAGYGTNTTVTRMALKAAVEGVSMLKSPVFLEIYTNIPQLSSGINKHIYEWERNEFKRKDGKNLKHEDLWRQLFELLAGPNKKVLHYKALYKKESPIPYNRILVTHTASQYAMKAKQELYEVSYDVS